MVIISESVSGLSLCEGETVNRVLYSSAIEYGNVLAIFLRANADDICRCGLKLDARDFHFAFLLIRQVFAAHKGRINLSQTNELRRRLNVTGSKYRFRLGYFPSPRKEDRLRVLAD